MAGTTASPAETARFDALAARWWDPDGPMRALHRMNPARIGWIVARSAASGIASVLDVGCGAGIAAEALARRGFQVLGLDAAGETIAAAQVHAAALGLPLAYRIGTAEHLLAEGLCFPIITALEVIEHVPDPQAFVDTLGRLLAPGGRLFLSTLNRTPQSFVAAKIAAEYVLRWLPVGTHDWRRFIRPDELSAMLRQAGLRVTDIAGLVPDPITGRWEISRNLWVNYIVAAEN